MTTIESKHLEYMKSHKTEEERINYLLGVADVLDAYGDQELKTDDIEQRSGNLNDFVEVVSTQNKGSLYKKFINITENIPEYDVEIQDTYQCDICNEIKIAIGTDSQMICPKCGVTDIYFDSGTQGLSYDQEINSEINISFAYKRINHFNEWLAQFQAKENTHIPTEMLDQLSNEFKKARIKKGKDITPNKVKLYLKKLNYNKFYEHVPHITNLLNGIEPLKMPPSLEETLRSMFRDIQEPFELYKPKVRSNFLSYSYCLYKFCELLEKDEYLICFPLLKSREKLHQQDCIWKRICKHMEWQYIPTV
uniref:Viral late gene transcription factor 3 zinc ribbon domain-containing protein n=1 Tax=viral metagenome TaxID=1070528 RepID=A0A6C0F5I9_9ZZZZ|tara:strand:+ start:4748 stop:5668 length:921 start_codon:yes stop_codon:yes gene_type:complete